MPAIRTILYIWLIGINLALFLVMGADKRAAKRRSRRVPENSLLALAVLGGSVGGILGMLIFRHKTQKLKFRILVPLFAVFSFAEICAAGLLAQKYL